VKPLRVCDWCWDQCAREFDAVTNSTSRRSPSIASQDQFPPPPTQQLEAHPQFPPPPEPETPVVPPQLVAVPEPSPSPAQAQGPAPVSPRRKISNAGMVATRPIAIGDAVEIDGLAEGYHQSPYGDLFQSGQAPRGVVTDLRPCQDGSEGAVVVFADPDMEPHIFPLYDLRQAVREYQVRIGAVVVAHSLSPDPEILNGAVGKVMDLTGSGPALIVHVEFDDGESAPYPAGLPLRNVTCVEQNAPPPN